MKKIEALLFAATCALAIVIPSVARHTTGTGRNRLSRPMRSYRHFEDQGKNDQWNNAPWFATHDEEFRKGDVGNPSVDRHSPANCPPGSICY